MRFLFAFLCLASLAACSQDKDEKGNSGGNGPMVNQTDYRVCGNSTPAGLHISSNTWVLRQSKGEFNFDMLLTADRGRVQLTTICMYQGRYLSAQVDVPASIGNSRLEIFAAGQRTERIDENNFKMDCSVNIERGVMNFGFKGRCLEMTRPGYNEKVLMVPR